MTEKQILELAQEHLEAFDFDGGADCAWSDFTATRDQILTFARAIYEEGYDDGCFGATNSTGL